MAAILIYANEYKKGWECFRSVCNLMCMIIRCTVRNLEASCSVKFCAITENVKSIMKFGSILEHELLLAAILFQWFNYKMICHY